MSCCVLDNFLIEKICMLAYKSSHWDKYESVVWEFDTLLNPYMHSFIFYNHAYPPAIRCSRECNECHNAFYIGSYQIIQINSHTTKITISGFAGESEHKSETIDNVIVKHKCGLITNIYLGYLNITRFDKEPSILNTLRGSIFPYFRKERNKKYIRYGINGKYRLLKSGKIKR